MADPALGGRAFDETAVFLSHFKDLTDPHQPGKVAYPLPEVLPLCLLAVLAGAETITDIALSAARSWTCCAASARSPTAHRRTITSATPWPRWTRSNSGAASSPGSRR